MKEMGIKTGGQMLIKKLQVEVHMLMYILYVCVCVCVCVLSRKQYCIKPVICLTGQGHS